MTEYREADLLKLAKRFHNTKRSYLLVDPLQGKHLSVSPTKALELFHALGKEIKKKFSGIKLVIGFAETATAIGMAVAEEMDRDCIYVHTTRENIPEISSWVEFYEEHSHAMDQKLDASNLEKWINVTDAIVFVDDEISTGKTLINFIDKLRCIYPNLDKKKLIGASIINRLSDEHVSRMKENGIECVSLLELENIDYEESVKKYSIKEAIVPEKTDFNISYEEIKSGVKLRDPRKGVSTEEYHNNCCKLAKDVLDKITFTENDCSVLIIGTEECMYPAIILGNEIEKLMNIQVYTQSTTRSPIGICEDEDYPIHNGYKLKSFYDTERITYLYNIRRYDKVIIVTDCENVPGKSIESLIYALKNSGNNNILLVRGIE